MVLNLQNDKTRRQNDTYFGFALQIYVALPWKCEYLSAVNQF